VELEFLQQLDPQGDLLRPILKRKSGTHNCYKPYEFPEGSCEQYFRQMQATEGQQRLNVLLEELGLKGTDVFNELNRTHWAIKRVDLIQELLEANIQIPVFNMQR
jgi:hypothetical protein